MQKKCIVFNQKVLKEVAFSIDREADVLAVTGVLEAIYGQPYIPRRVYSLTIAKLSNPAEWEALKDYEVNPFEWLSSKVEERQIDYSNLEVVQEPQPIENEDGTISPPSYSAEYEGYLTAKQNLNSKWVWLPSSWIELLDQPKQLMSFGEFQTTYGDE